MQPLKAPFILTLVTVLSLLGALTAPAALAHIPTASAAQRAFTDKMARSARSTSYRPTGNYSANCQAIVTKHARLCRGFFWQRHRSMPFIVRRCDTSANVTYVNLRNTLLVIRYHQICYWIS